MRWPPLTTIAAVPLVAALLQGQEAPPDLRKAGEEAYLFAYPMVLLDATHRAAKEPAPPNAFRHQQEFSVGQSGDAPSADTLYSVAWLDLSKEPVLLHVPDTRGRYYLVQVIDAWGENVSVPGKRTTGTGEGWFAIVGPKWEGRLPQGAGRIDSPTATTLLVGRIQTNTAADYPNVHALQRQFRLVPLSLYPAGGPTSSSSPGRWGVSIAPHQLVSSMSTAEFFSVFARLLADNPPHAEDARMIKQLASLGIEAGKPFSPDKLDPMFEHGVATAKEMLEHPVKRLAFVGAIGTTGWTSMSGVGRYGVNYAKRAAVARVGLVANAPEDGVYMGCRQDRAGQPLDGTREYVMHFEKAQLPPVRAFWSVTLYDLPGNFVANPANRYAIGDRDPLKYNADGSLDLYVQRQSPGAEREANWLPAPAERFKLLFRLYWPAEAVLKGEWTPPALVPRAPDTEE